MFYKENDGLKYIMEQRWNEKSEDEFPKTKNELIKNFEYIESFLNNKYHPNVNIGAAISGDGVLTDHGVEHVQAVMDKAFKIIKEKVHLLKGYEIFLLLVAIHFHDLGNISGRQDHETKIIEIMDEMGDQLPMDVPEKELVVSIATAHGGFADDAHKNKDTLRSVYPETHCNGIIVRPIILAAVLRFADELSDDFNRFVNIDIPPENKIFHEYSKSLEPVGFNGKTLSFKYRIPYEKTKETMKKGSKEIYLYDEIRLRLSKCLLELDYCRKYADRFIDITTLSVSIKIMDPKNTIKSCDSDQFRLSLFGYPNENDFCLEDHIVNEDISSDDNSTKKPKYSSGEELKNAMMKRECK